MNVPHTDGDSWLCIKGDGKTILNINDCVIENTLQAAEINTLIGKSPVDVLFTQFSYANWAGNKEDSEKRRSIATNKIKQVQYQVEVFKPKYTIPFASFVWFSHEENFYMNDEINTIDIVEKFISKNLNTLPIIMFPNDHWEVGTTYDNIESLSKWSDAYQKVDKSNTTKTSSINEEKLIISGSNFIEQLKKDNTKWMNLFLKPSYIYVKDYGKAFKLDLKSGFTSVGKSEIDWDISLSSNALSYCFNHLWGGSTTRINGRFQVPKNGNFYNWKMYFQTAQLNNLGEKFDFGFVLNSIKRRVLRKVANT